jgi:hypothetical protein
MLPRSSSRWCFFLHLFKLSPCRSSDRISLLLPCTRRNIEIHLRQEGHLL